jgi:hypothetical protein
VTAVVSDHVAWWKRPETTYRVLVHARRSGDGFTLRELGHKVASHEHVRRERAMAAVGRARKLVAIAKDGGSKGEESTWRITIIGRRLLVAGALEAAKLDRWEDE